MPHEHVVVEGEGTTRISEQYGFDARTIWLDPANAALRSRRSDMNALLPGDVLMIPDKRAKYIDCATGAHHRFRRRGIPAKYRLRVLWGGRPVADRPYVLTVDGAPLSGRTTANGIVEKSIPAAASRGQLVIDMSRDRQLRYRIRFGSLHPIEEASGVQQRLANLGYDVDPPGELGQRTRTAIRLFQAKLSLPVTGSVDDATREALRGAHDRVGSAPPEDGY